MKTILEQLREEFRFIGDEQISGKTALQIIGTAFEEHEKQGHTYPLLSVSQRSELLAIEALNRIARPVKYLQDKAEKEGNVLDGAMAVQLSKDTNFIQEIAVKALREIANSA